MLPDQPALRTYASPGNGAEKRKAREVLLPRPGKPFNELHISGDGRHRPTDGLHHCCRRGCPLPRCCACLPLQSRPSFHLCCPRFRSCEPPERSAG